MDLYLKVRLARRGGMSEREAAGHFGISRASVKKIMMFSVPPGYQQTAQIKRPKLDGFTGFIDEWMQDDLILHVPTRQCTANVHHDHQADDLRPAVKALDEL